MARIVFFETEKWEEPLLKENLQGEDVFFCPHTLEENQEYDGHFFDAEIISVFAFSQVTKNVLEKFKNLRFVTTRSTGYDHIDLPYCKEKGIVVSNVPSYGVHTVAEHTFALILSLSRRIVESTERTKKGDFSVEGLTGIELFGKTLGVVGTGNIGSVVCQIGLGFGLKVIANNRHEDEDLKSKGVEFVSFDDLLSKSDIITIHMPLIEETKHLINMGNISKIKPGAILINAARGPILETQAVLEGLEKKILAGVGLDVLEEECSLREERELMSTKFLETCNLKTQLMDHMLLNREDVVITPHNAFNSKEALDQILHITIANIKGFISNQPQNVVGS
jgi:D-lactate dehydrogenase